MLTTTLGSKKDCFRLIYGAEIDCINESNSEKKIKTFLRWRLFGAKNTV